MGKLKETRMSTFISSEGIWKKECSKRIRINKNQSGQMEKDIKQNFSIHKQKSGRK